MPRSTSGMAVSMESELVTLPSSPSLRSTLYRGSRLSKRSACACAFAFLPVVARPHSHSCSHPRPLLPRGGAGAVARVGRLLLGATAEAACSPRCTPSCTGSLSYLEKGEKRGIAGETNAHLLVHVERIGLLRKVVRAHPRPHLGRFVLWLSNKAVSQKERRAAKGPFFFYSEPDSSADTCAPGCNPPAGISSPSSDLRRRFFFVSPWSAWMRRFLAVHGGNLRKLEELRDTVGPSGAH